MKQSNREHMEWLEKYIKKHKRQDLKKKLKDNYYDNRLNGGRKNENK